MLMAIATFYRELRRRRVLNTLLIYMVCCWVIMQIVDVLFPVIGLEDSDAQIILVLIAVGLPVCFISAWFFQITKNAVVKTPPFEEQRVYERRLQTLPRPSNRRTDDRRSSFVLLRIANEHSSAHISAPSQWQLRCETAPFKGQLYLVNSEITFGRGKNCEIRTADPRVSRQHAVIRIDNDKLQVQDLSSNSGTFVNGKKVEQATLLHGDEVHFGKIEFVVVGGDNADAVTSFFPSG
ncbi:MAG: hypothetical protein ACI89U_001751 [Gammaproteobacteria bacterium]|jgi:hypothetical protein